MSDPLHTRITPYGHIELGVNTPNTAGTFLSQPDVASLSWDEDGGVLRWMDPEHAEGEQELPDDAAEAIMMGRRGRGDHDGIERAGYELTPEGRADIERVAEVER